MTPDPKVWYQARIDGPWYRHTETRRKDPHYITTCGRCGREFLGKRKAQFCSRTCSVRHRVQPPAEIPDWIDTAIWRPGSQGTWYKGDGKHAYVIKVCKRCNGNYLGTRSAQFCSVICGSGGDGKSYTYAHDCVGREKGRARDHACADCGAQAAEWSYDGLDPDELTEPESGKRYSFNSDHYEPRCHCCHASFDGHVGQGNGNAKLTDAQRCEIRVSVGATQQELADRYGVTQGHISKIKRATVADPEDYRDLIGSPSLAVEAEEYLRQMGGPAA